MADLNKSISFVLENEGGYVNDKKDNGQETFYGISRKYNPAWEGWKIIDEIKEKYPVNSVEFNKEILSDDLNNKVSSFYLNNYWNPLKLNDVKIQKLATKIFDMSVNLGIPRTAGIVQSSVNLLSFNELKLDNIVGESTINLLNTATEKDNGEFLLKLLTIQQGYIYIKLCQLNASQEKFIKGWINRLHITVGEF